MFMRVSHFRQRDREGVWLSQESNSHLNSHGPLSAEPHPAGHLLGDLYAVQFLRLLAPTP